MSSGAEYPAGRSSDDACVPHASTSRDTNAANKDVSGRLAQGIRILLEAALAQYTQKNASSKEKDMESGDGVLLES